MEEEDGGSMVLLQNSIKTIFTMKGNGDAYGLHDYISNQGIFYIHGNLDLLFKL